VEPEEVESSLLDDVMYVKCKHTHTTTYAHTRASIAPRLSASLYRPRHKPEVFVWPKKETQVREPRHAPAAHTRTHPPVCAHVRPRTHARTRARTLFSL
jgi:hypothetical protein